MHRQARTATAILAQLGACPHPPPLKRIFVLSHLEHLLLLLAFLAEDIFA